MDSLEIILERYDGQMTQAEKEALAEEKNNLYRQLLANMSPADLSAEVKETLDALRGMGLKLAIGSHAKTRSSFSRVWGWAITLTRFPTARTSPAASPIRRFS